MSVSAPDLARVAAELAAVLPGAHVQKLYVPHEHAVLLNLRLPGRSVLLRLDATPGSAHVGVIEERPESPGLPPGEQGLWRLHLTGARVDHVDCAGLALRLNFSTDGGARSGVADVRRGGGLLLLDASERVLGALPRTASKRGVHYSPDAVEDLRSVAAGGLSAAKKSERAGESAASTDLSFARDVASRFEAQAQADASARLRTEVSARLRAARRRTSRTLEKIRADGDRIAESERYRQFGDLLKPALSRIPRGSTSATVVEYGADGAHEVVVPLLPHLSPRENLERYYHLHRRLSRSSGRVAERLAAVTAQQAELDALLESARTADAAALVAVRERAGELGLLRETPIAAGVPAARPPYREFLSANGSRILVGRNAKLNDVLTFRVAKGNDLWLHVRGSAGSHVVVPGADGPDGDTLLDAAELAAHFSSVREERAVDVSATRAKYVRKVPGTPGAVTHSQEKTVRLRREPERLARLLATEKK